ncbi:MAG: hypothetical protein ACJ76J_28350 [Thermoanaerobaculia bacterium]
MKTEKKFDAVMTMREIRDAISREIQGMSFEQQREYMRKQLKSRSEGDREGCNRRQPN